jgi:hypothetical protein
MPQRSLRARSSNSSTAFSAPLTLPDTTTLAALGWDPGSLPGLAAKINDQDWHGVEVDVGAIQRCADISDVIAVVAAAES